MLGTTELIPKGRVVRDKSKKSQLGRYALYILDQRFQLREPLNDENEAEIGI